MIFYIALFLAIGFLLIEINNRHLINLNLEEQLDTLKRKYEKLIKVLEDKKVPKLESDLKIDTTEETIHLRTKKKRNRKQTSKKQLPIMEFENTTFTESEETVEVGTSFIRLSRSNTKAIKQENVPIIKITKSVAQRLRGCCFKCSSNTHLGNNCQVYAGCKLANYLCQRCKLAVHRAVDCKQSTEAQVAVEESFSQSTLQ